MANKGETGILTLYSDVQATAVRWLWYPFIAVGKITLLQGDPGDGKSTMMMNLIAELSKGGTLPDGKIIGMPQRVIYQCSEDGVSDTIKPRLEKCGADCRNVAFINEETYSGLTLDDERIRQAIIEFRPRLVVIDPIQAYLGSDSDLQIAGRARKLMQRLGMVNYICISRFNAFGAVIGTICAEVIVCLVQLVAVQKKIPIWKYIAQSVPYILIGIFMTVVVRAIGNSMGVRVVSLVAQVIIGGIVYCAISLVYMLISHDDLVSAITSKIKKKT